MTSSAFDISRVIRVLAVTLLLATPAAAQLPQQNGAAKEGGFLGFKAVRVSEGEQRMLDEIAAALGAT